MFCYFNLFTWFESVVLLVIVFFCCVGLINSVVIASFVFCFCVLLLVCGLCLVLFT